jgi:tyrosyl-tRNA synthetase
MLSTSDADIERFLKMFTFMPLEKISQVMAEHQAAPEKRVAQHLLATEFLELSHGAIVAKETAEKHATRASQRRSISVQAAFEQAKTEAFNSLAKGNNSFALPINQSLNKRAPMATPDNTRPETIELQADFLAITNFPSVLLAVGLVGSKSEGQRLISNKGAYVAKYQGEMSDVLNWRAITKTEVGTPLKWVVWAGPDSEKGLLALRVGKWKVKIAHVRRPKPTKESLEALQSGLDELASLNAAAQ